MSGSCDAVLALNIQNRLRISAPHHSVGITACLMGAGGVSNACSRKGCCSGILWIRGYRGGVRARLVLIPCSCAIVASARSTLVRATMPCKGSIVSALNQLRNGATHRVIPMASDFTCIICHVVSGSRKEETISGWNRERGARDAWVTKTLYVFWVSGSGRGYPGERRSNKASISAACGTATSVEVRHYGCTTTIFFRRPRRMFLAKARTFPSSGVGCTKDGVTN